jgi:3-oxoacyl-[acyl-carrier protein] reductase
MAKIAIVTGASRGIGRAIAKRLAADGFAVVVNYAGGSKAAQEVVDEIRHADGEALPLQADISNPEQVKQMFEKTIEAYGHIDVVVNNAGIMENSLISKGDVASFDRVIATNLRGTFVVFAEAARRVAEGGRLIGFSSSVLGLNLPTYGAYIASKAGVEGLVRVLANEMRGRKVTVNAVAPGPVATELFLTGKTPEQIDHLSKLNPLERLGQVEVATAFDHLLARCSGWNRGPLRHGNEVGLDF